MKRLIGVLVVGMAQLSGCGGIVPPTASPQSNSPQPTADAPVEKINLAPSPTAEATAAPGVGLVGAAGSMDEIVAKVSGEPITMRQLVGPLIESHGLTMLVNLVELELARQNAAKYHVVVTQKDFDDEHDRTLEKMFRESDEPKLMDALDTAVAKNDAAEEKRLRGEVKQEREDYLAQFLINQHIDRVEFDLVLKTNTYLRKILEADWKDKITDKDVEAAFGQMYGERVKVKYIDLANMNEVIEAQRRLHNGDSFEEVAKDMSHDKKTAPLGGELPAFSREGKVPPAFLSAAFNPGLHIGQISDVVAVGSSYMLIKKIEIIAPKAVQFKDVKDSVRKKLTDALMEAGLKGMKKQLALEARQQMEIIYPMLKQQVKENADRQEKADKKAKDELDRQQRIRDGLKLPPALRPKTQPTTGTSPATGDAPQAPDAAAGERPPATGPGLDHPFVLPRLGPDTQPSVVAPEANK